MTYLLAYIAVVSEDKEGIIADGYIGISWMAVKALTDQPLAEYEISQLLEVMQEAEDILVDSGISFMPDYKFHGKNRGRHKQRNNALRKRIGLNEFKRRLIKKEEE